jgi:hypothetical protein
MNTPSDGGPYHPIPWTKDPGIAQGLSLRDWLAGMALQGIASRLPWDGDEDEAAKQAYALADAMIQQREKGGV